MDKIIDHYSLNYKFNWCNMNKHFMTLYIHSKTLGKYSMMNIFLEIMKKLKINKKKCKSDWVHYSKNIVQLTQNWKKPKYFNETIDYISPNVVPHQILNFLYYYNYTVEEFLASVAPPSYDNTLLFYDAMRIFSEIHYYLDDPFCTKTDSNEMSHACPILGLSLKYYFNWNDVLTNNC